MFEIRVPTKTSLRKIVVSVVYLFLVSLFVSIFNVVLSYLVPEHSGGLFCISGLIVFFFVLYLAYGLFAGARAIVLIENMMYIDRGMLERVSIDLNYTRKLVFSGGLRKMSVTDAGGRKKEFRISDFGPENIQKLINELSEVADRYGFLLVDENSDTSWGKVKGHALEPDERATTHTSASSEDETPYKVK